VCTINDADLWTAQDSRWSAVKRMFVKKHDVTNDSAFVDGDVV